MANQQNPDEPQTVDEARDAVARSRERISSTLDRLEDRIVEKKHELQDRADVFRPVKQQVRTRPLIAIAVGFTAGWLLGSMGGHKGDQHDVRSQRERHRHHDTSDADRRELREWRARRRERLYSRAGENRHDHQQNGHLRIDGVKQQLVGAMTSALSAAVTSGVKDFVRDRSHNRAAMRIH